MKARQQRGLSTQVERNKLKESCKILIVEHLKRCGYNYNFAGMKIACIIHREPISLYRVRVSYIAFRKLPKLASQTNEVFVTRKGIAAEWRSCGACAAATDM